MSAAEDVKVRPERSARVVPGRRTAPRRYGRALGGQVASQAGAAARGVRECASGVARSEGDGRGRAEKGRSGGEGTEGPREYPRPGGFVGEMICSRTGNRGIPLNRHFGADPDASRTIQPRDRNNAAVQPRKRTGSPRRNSCAPRTQSSVCWPRSQHRHRGQRTGCRRAHQRCAANARGGRAPAATCSL